MRRLALVLLSGGLDSTTAATLARQQGYELSALTAQYGQTHAREIEAARQVATALDLPHRVVDVSFYRDLAWYSALTSADRFTPPDDRPPESMADDIPITYVPLRNTFFLTLAAAALESQALDVIEREGVPPTEVATSLFIAANAIDYSGYPDCRPEYYRVASETIRLGSKLGTQYGVPIQIETPLIDKSKADIVRLGVQLGAPLALTWSCYRPGPRPCGRCDSCVLRAQGFAAAGVADPALTSVPPSATGEQTTRIGAPGRREAER
jgi:7-cyano-7-deazaguanine synthase